MKKLTVLVFAILFISCDKDIAEDFENNSSSSDSDYRVIGNYYDLSINGGTQGRELYEYINNDNSYDPNNYSNLFAEFGLTLPYYRNYYSDKMGITILENSFGSDFTFNYKDFETNEIFKVTIPYFEPDDWSYWHYNQNIYFLYRDYYSFDPVDGTIEYKIKSIDIKTNQEIEKSIGRFKRAENSIFEPLHVSDHIYFLWNQDRSSEVANKSLIVMNLDGLVINDIKTIPKNDLYNLVGDRNGDIYLFGAYGVNYKYNFNLNELEEINIPGETVRLSATYNGKKNPQFIVDDIFFGTRIGAQPSSGGLYPIIYDLKSGKDIIIQVVDEITKFDSDEVEWQPLVKCYTVDYKNKVILLGVTSYNFGGQYHSQGIFTVDFEGNILDKQKLPIIPIQIIK